MVLTPQRILVVDDEPKICDFVGRALSNAGYGIEIARSGAEALDRVARHGYGLVILDLVMPGLDGRSVLTRLLRLRPGQAVLVLSCRSDVATKVDCLEHGAQDYLTKPFSLAELLARVRIRLRAAAVEEPPPDGRLRAGRLTLDVGHLSADRGHGPVSLTRLEFLLLRELMDRTGEAISKERLLATVWGYDFDPASNVVDVCVRRLRRKFGYDLVTTVRGEGYRLAAD